MRTYRYRFRITAVALCIGLLAGCSGTPERRVNDTRTSRKEPPPTAFEIVVKTLNALDAAIVLSPKDARALQDRASFLIKIGDVQGALSDLKTALSSSSAKADLQLRASLLYIGAWALMKSGDRPGARRSMDKAIAADPDLERVRPVLEFRLIAEERGRQEAYDYAKAALGDPSTSPETAELLSVMIGSRDFRDVRYESDRQRSDYALYLSGYRVEPDSATLGAEEETHKKGLPEEAPEGAPVIVLGEPESVGADEAALAVARLAYRDALIRENAFRIVDSDSRRAAVEELELSLSDAAAGRKDQALGSLFAADYVASGSVVRSDAGWLVAYTLSSSQDGIILASEFDSAPDHEAIQALADRFASSLGNMVRSGRLRHRGTAPES